MLQKAGQKRTLLSFDLSEQVGKEVTSAKLRLYITYIADSWGTSGRTIDLYKISNSWVEGNGNNFRPKPADSDTAETPIRGSGHGVTWSCADDSNIGNGKANCTSVWNGDLFANAKTSTAIVGNAMLGEWVEFDVTADVNAFTSGQISNHGWLVKRTNESQAGRVGFTSAENADTSNAPQLVLTFG